MQASEFRGLARAVCVCLISVLAADPAPAAKITSRTPAAQPASVTAGGDSEIQAMTPDARYVLFISTANNLVPNTGFPTAQPIKPRLNLFLRDRQSGETKLVSANLNGQAGNGDCFDASLSTNGTIAVFESDSSDLVAADTNELPDVFLRSLKTDETILVSIGAGGESANGSSLSPVMTPDGRYVAFVSAASNLVPDDTNSIPDVFVRDIQLGQTRLASTGATATTWLPSRIPDNLSTAPEITPDGSFVAFFSTATNLVPGVATTNELYLRDMEEDTTYLVSTNARALLFQETGNFNCIFHHPSLSDTGRYVVFAGSVIGSPGYGTTLLFSYDRDTQQTEVVSSNVLGPRLSLDGSYPMDHWFMDMTPGGRFVIFVSISCSFSGNNTCLQLWDRFDSPLDTISVTTNGTPATEGLFNWPTIDDSGRFVSFASTAPDLVTNATSGNLELFVRDTLTQTTTLISADTNGMATGFNLASAPALFSTNGTAVAFSSVSPGLVENDLNNASDVFVREITNNVAELVSVRDSGLESRSTGVSGTEFSLSEDGRYLSFVSESDHLVPFDTNGLRDVFVKDLTTDSITLVSVSTNGLSSANGVSFQPSISGNGRYVAFTSWASDLVAGDNDQFQDIFVRDLLTGTTTNATSVLGGQEFQGPQIDYSGRFLLFQNTLPPTIYLRDLMQTPFPRFLNSTTKPLLTPDGQFVLYVSGSPALWRNDPGMNTWTGQSIGNELDLGISRDGRRVAYGNNNVLYAADTATNHSWTVSAGVVRGTAGLNFSADGRLLAFATTNSHSTADSNGLADVYLYDLDTEEHLLISFNPLLGLANGDSDAPDISADGRFVVFQSTASNLVPDDTNSVPDIFLFDRNRSALSCISRPRNTDGTSDNRSSSPRFSANGRCILFHSWAENLDRQDSNHHRDIFAVNITTPTIVATSTSATISWLTAPDWSYEVEYKNSLTAPGWQLLDEPINFVGPDARITDLNPNPGQRWYRVVAE